MKKIILKNKIVDVKENYGWKRVKAKEIAPYLKGYVRIVTEDDQWYIRQNNFWKLVRNIKWQDVEGIKFE